MHLILNYFIISYVSIFSQSNYTLLYLLQTTQHVFEKKISWRANVLFDQQNNIVTLLIYSLLVILGTKKQDSAGK